MSPIVMRTPPMRSGSTARVDVEFRVIGFAETGDESGELGFRERACAEDAERPRARAACSRMSYW